MVPIHSFWLLQVPFILFYRVSLVVAAPWIVTENYGEVVVTVPKYYVYDDRSTVITTPVPITPTVTALPKALSTITSVATTDDIYGYSSGDITVIQKLYPTGVGNPVGPEYGDPYDPNDVYRLTVFKVNITYTAPTGCSSQFTTTTAVEVIPPQEVQQLLPRTAVATSTSIDSSHAFDPTTYTYDVVYVDPTQIPSSSLEYISATSRPTGLYSSSGCDPYNYHGYADDGPGHPYHEESWFLDPWELGIGISGLALTLILIFGWIGLFLILGFIEAWVRFRRLMTGWQTRRGPPVFWALTLIPISLPLLCLFRKGYRARSEADAIILRERWAEMSLGTKLRLFFLWGFCYQYPPMIGPAPALVKTSKRPDNNPGPCLLSENQEPMEHSASSGDVSRAETVRAPLPSVPEVAEVAPSQPENHQ